MNPSTILCFVSGGQRERVKLVIGTRDSCARLAGLHSGPVLCKGANRIARIEDVVFDPYANEVGSLEIHVLEEILEAEAVESNPDFRLVGVRDALQDPAIIFHPAERYFLRKFAQDGLSRIGLSRNRALWEELGGIAGDQMGPDLWIVPIKTPTIPPAKHTNMPVLAGPGLVVDPGAKTKEQREKTRVFVRRIEEEAGPLQAIFLTHHHHDHVGGAAWLSRECGLPIWAHRETAKLVAGQFAVDRLFEDGESIPTPKGLPSGWVAIHSPGHAAGHLCLFHEPTGRLIAGDMMAGVGTILVEPSEGNMGVYIRSLERLAEMKPSIAIPAHGPVLCQGTEKLRFYVSHRLAREEKIYAAITQSKRAMHEVLAEAYDDAPPQALPFAALSLESHVQKLEEEGRVARDGKGAVYRL